MPISRYGMLLLLIIPPLFGETLSFNTAAEQFLQHNYDLQIAKRETGNPLRINSGQF
ncbi:MAG: hypothetical protein PHW64_00845 [Sulfuricurvum sp.]|nr:hypothetical protein [Sulfuricurvum sp.]